MRIVIAVLFSCFLFGMASAQSNSRSKKTVYEEVDLENVMKRYFGK